MATYIVKRHQNIFDVAIDICGSIEGIYDLLISNDWLSMDTDLQAGMEITYHEGYVINQSIVNEIQAQGYKPINGERHVYHKKMEAEQIFQIDIPVKYDNTALVVAGEGTMYVDWGDNSDIQAIELSHTVQTVEHFFDNTVDKRVMKIYGQFSLLSWDATPLNGQIYTFYPVTVDEFSCKANDYPLEGLFLFEGTVKLDLGGMYLKDLSPIYDMSLQELDLRGAHIDTETIDAYLQHIVEHYGSRRNCQVYLTREPSAAGMGAIETILGETEWNASGAWMFNINGTIYTV